MIRLLKIGGIIIAIFITTVLHIGVAFILPPPFSMINVIFIMAILLLLYFESGWVIWIVFSTHLILELYTTTTPFGIVLISSTLSILFAYWIYRNILTNRSWYSGIALTFLTLVMFRFIFCAAILVVSVLLVKYDIYWSELLLSFVWESLISSLIVGILFILMTIIKPNLKHSSVDKFAIIRW